MPSSRIYKGGNGSFTDIDLEKELGRQVGIAWEITTATDIQNSVPS